MNTFEVNFPKRLLKERKRLGLTQTQLGKYGGVRRAAQYLYEKGERTPSIQYLYDISMHGADFKFLLTGERTVKTGGKITLDPETIQRLYVIVDQVSRDSKGKLFDLEYRQNLMLKLSELVSDQDKDQINWSELEKSYGI